MDLSKANPNLLLGALVSLVIASIMLILGVAVVSATHPGYDGTPLITTGMGFIGLIGTSLLAAYHAQRAADAANAASDKVSVVSERLENGLIVEKTKQAISESASDGTGTILSSS